MSDSFPSISSKKTIPLRNVILIGFMGTGKTSIGKRVAQSLGFDFVDTDALIVESSGKEISEIFSSNGEDFFRDLETKALQSCGERSKQVIATGGGLVLRKENRALLKQFGYVIWLRSSPEAILDRISRNQERPLLQTPNPLATIVDLLDHRENLYQSSSNFAIDTDELSIEETTFGICESTRVKFAKI